jgi:1-phosphofructokinase
VITTLTPSPSLDLEYQLPNLQIGAVNRAGYFGQRAGGKGVNVSRVLVRMGVATNALVPLNEAESGTFLASAEVDRIPIKAIEIESGVRFNVTLLHNQKTTKINAATKAWSKKESKRISDAFHAQARKSEFAVIGGSLPESTPTQWLSDLVRENKSRTRIVVDSSGPALKEVLSASPYMIKPNRDEAEELLNSSIRDLSDAKLAAQELRKMGPETILLSLGSAGSVYCSSESLIHIRPAELAVQSTVGAGDALLAGFVGSFSKGLEFALACGTAWAEAIISNHGLHLDVAVQESTVKRIIASGRIKNLLQTESSHV